MKLIRLLTFLLLLITILPGCKTSRIPSSDQEILPEEVSELPSSVLRGLVISSTQIDKTSSDFTEDKIVDIIDKADEANYNVVFISLGDKYWSLKPFSDTIASEFQGYDTPGYDPVEEAVEAAHEKGLKIYITLDGYRLLNQENLIFPNQKTILKKNVRSFIENYNIDGLCFDFSRSTEGVSLEEKSSDDNQNNNFQSLPITGSGPVADKLIDILEDIVVEAMLIKPYLVNSLIFPFNDTWKVPYECLSKGIVDFIVPEIEINKTNAIEELDNFWRVNSEKGNLVDRMFPLFSLRENHDNGEIMKELAGIMLENGGEGVLFREDLQENNSNSTFSLHQPFSEKINLREDLKQITPFQIVGLDLNALFTEADKDRAVYIFQGTKAKIPDSRGNIGFIAINPDTIDLEIGEKQVILPTNRWSIPFRYNLAAYANASRESPWVEFRRMPSRITDNPEYYLLCKTDYPASAWINGNSVKIYKTGIFFNKITLKEGPNRVRASIITPDSLTAFYEEEFIYRKVDKTRKSFPLWIDTLSVEPRDNMELLPRDVVQVRFNGSLDQEAYVELYPGGELIKCMRENYDDYSVYLAEIPLMDLQLGKPYQMILRMTALEETSEDPLYELPLQSTIIVRDLDEFPVVKIVQENSRLTYNMGPIRLGGPIRAELGPGIVLKVNGKIGENFRIRLNDIENGIISQEDVEILPEESFQPTYFISSISCAPGEDADVISIPYLEPVPYEIYPDPDLNRIVVTIFGAKTSSTWITHRKGRKIVDKITWQQTTPDTYQIYVNLKTSKIWGYDIYPDGKRLLLQVKYPPVYDLSNEKPLTGLKIALEAGHGGESTGAVGLSGLLEKDINLDLTKKLGKICEKMGADVLLVRSSDTTMTLIDKRAKAITSGADLLISIHANAAGLSRGYLGVPGTSTYYHNPFWAPLAESIYNHLLELGLEEFGVVGSFNYTVTRVSQMPSLLVEQAFMTHAEDEEKLADPVFRQKMAQKIYDGLIDYLTYMKKK